jgi:hypothetical protein
MQCLSVRSPDRGTELPNAPFKGRGRFCTVAGMPDDLQSGSSSLFRLLTAKNAAQMRAVRYREQAAQLREMAIVEDHLELRGKLQVLAEKYDELATTLIRRFRRDVFDTQPGQVHRNEAARLRTAALAASAPETRQRLLTLAEVHDALATADNRLARTPLPDHPANT